MPRGATVALLLVASGCASLQRAPVPPAAARVVVVIGTACPKFRLAVHEDGLIEYWSDSTARVSGVGWSRVDAEVVERLRHLTLVHPRKIADIEDDGWCRVFDAPGSGIAVLGPEGWSGQCDVRSEQEAEVLGMLGVGKWLQLKPEYGCVGGA